MNKKQLLISVAPILGCFFYSFYLFLVEREKFMKLLFPMLSGMGAFWLVYGGFAAICNATAFDVMAHEWLLYLMLAISGILWNIAYFLVLNKRSQ